MGFPAFASSHKRRARLVSTAFALVIIDAALASCGGGSGGAGAAPASTYTATSGVAQKGPLIKGSTVTAQELDASLSPTGQQFSFQITSNLGSFLPTSTFASQYIGLNATGYYFDEVLNGVSSGQITLNGYSDLAAGTVLNVNLLTTLAYQRIAYLVTHSGMAFAAARTQAEGEVLTALNIPSGSYGSFDALDLSGSSDGDHILAAVSCLFVYGNSAGPLSALMANFQSDIGANGVITSSATKAALVAAGKAINPTAVATNLTQYYSSAGLVFTAANISAWIDQDGDGVIGKFKFQVADATPSSAFSLPAFVVSQVAGTSISVSSGVLTVNGTQATGAVSVQASDVVTVSPPAGMTFPNGVTNVYLLSGGTKIARVSFVSGLVSIAVTPANPGLPIGLTQQLIATGTFSDTSTAVLTGSVAWTSGTPAVATVGAASGLVSAVAQGSTLITATSGSVAGSTTLNVTSAVVESIAITPNPAFAAVGIPAQLTATGTYSDGSTTNITSGATWTSSAPSVATVGPTTGLTIGAALGSATISAKIGSVTATVPLSVVANTWEPTGSMTAPRFYHTATLLPNGKVLVVGGIPVGTLPAASTPPELYDPASGTWSSTGNIELPIINHTATLLPNGKVLVAGGYTVNGVTASAEIYDPVAGTWSTTGSLATARVSHQATLLANGKVLVEGGTAGAPSGEFGGPLASAELYDPASGTWSSTGILAAARTGHTATLLQNGKVLVVGGAGGSNGATALSSAELYDPVAGTWSSTASLPAPRSAPATLLPSGAVLVAGGSGDTSAVLYDPVAGTWSPTGNMAEISNSQTATLLANGTVLVAGGSGASGLLAGAEIYDPVAGTWAITGSLITARASNTMTLLQNGVVLVTGGVQSDTESPSWIISSCELFW